MDHATIMRVAKEIRHPYVAISTPAKVDMQRIFDIKNSKGIERAIGRDSRIKSCSNDTRTAAELSQFNH